MGHSKQNAHETALTLVRMAAVRKQKIARAGEDVERLESWGTLVSVKGERGSPSHRRAVPQK